VHRQTFSHLGPRKAEDFSCGRRIKQWSVDTELIVERIFYLTCALRAVG
jgi:hypothetical protein